MKPSQSRPGSAAASAVAIGAERELEEEEQEQRRRRGARWALLRPPLDEQVLPEDDPRPPGVGHGPRLGARR